MKKTEKIKKWKATQEHWDDKDFLETKANAFMKLRWKRLNERAAGVCAGLGKELGRRLDLVDLGAGHADFFSFFKLSVRSYTGVEPSKALLKKSVHKKQDGVNFHLVRGKGEKIPLPAGRADMVLIKEVLDHCYDPLKVFLEVRRVLRPGGLVLVTLTNDRAWYKLAMPWMARKIKSGQHDHLHYFYPEQVRSLAILAGFKNVQSEDSHYLRLPNGMEQWLGSLPEWIGKAKIAATDAVGELILPDLGGSFWVMGTAPAAERERPRR